MRISDWSSDVCSSDLAVPLDVIGADAMRVRRPARLRHPPESGQLAAVAALPLQLNTGVGIGRVAEILTRDEPLRADRHGHAAAGDLGLAAAAECRTEVDADIGLDEFQRVDLPGADRGILVFQIGTSRKSTRLNSSH